MPQCRMEGEWDVVKLVPFAHQVGGHSTVLRYDDKTVCKALIHREHQFYRTMPPEMKEFTPQYRGVIEVSVHTDSDGYITLVAQPSTLRRNSLNTSLPSFCEQLVADEKVVDNQEHSAVSESAMSTQHQHRFRVRRSGSVEIEGLSRSLSDLELRDGGASSHDVYATRHNTWSLRCHKEHLAKLKTGKLDQYSNKFILLENLTCSFDLPCILDLKMGTRQHGDDASQEKKQSQINKCNLSTSSHLGLRICGMQVYQANTGKYICHNKYYGRRLTEAGVRETLYQFLHNGMRLRLELVQPIIVRLHQLLGMLTNQNTFRFYSSSLLIMYEGADCSRVDLKPESPESDVDYSGGRWHQVGACASEVEEKLPGDKAAHRPIVDDLSKFKSEKRQTDSKDHSVRNGSHSCSPKISVRMIDFAHATHQGFLQDQTSHVGPDHGYIFGLKNLIQLFQRLYDDNIFSVSQ